jgi:hypothetical protein
VTKGVRVENAMKRAARRTAAPILGALQLRGRREKHVFAESAPDPQAAIDIFAGQWITAFPPELGVRAGSVNHFDPEVDPRVPWVASQLTGGLTGMSVLELGPFEAYQTALIEAQGAASVLAVEGSQTAYLKCLVVKELLALKARFLYGDVLKYLASSSERFDIVWASGILYHQTDPVGLLERVAARTDRVFLHTHYIDPDRTSTSLADERFDPKGDVVVSWRGQDLRLHCYRYVDDWATKGFAGGPRDHALWMERDDLEFVLRELGLTEITFGVIDRENPAGAAMFLLAARPGLG